MDSKFTVQLPEDVLRSLHASSDAAETEIRRAAAVKLYEMQRLSQEQAAKLAGVARSEFVELLSEFNVSPFQVTPDELTDEWKRGHRS